MTTNISTQNSPHNKLFNEVPPLSIEKTTPLKQDMETPFVSGYSFKKLRVYIQKQLIT